MSDGWLCRNTSSCTLVEPNGEVSNKKPLVWIRTYPVSVHAPRVAYCLSKVVRHRLIDKLLCAVNISRTHFGKRTNKQQTLTTLRYRSQHRARFVNGACSLLNLLYNDTFTGFRPIPNNHVGRQRGAAAKYEWQHAASSDRQQPDGRNGEWAFSSPGAGYERATTNQIIRTEFRNTSTSYIQIFTNSIQIRQCIL